MPADLSPTYAGPLLRPLFGNRMIPRGANPGLIFDRFLRIWNGYAVAKEPLRSLQEFASQFEELGSEYGRWLNDLHRRLSMKDVKEARFRTTARLTMGLGNPHPLGNGFCFDWTMGIPCIPGSAVKGLCRAWTCVAEESEDRVAAVLGKDSEEDNSGKSGDIVFFPAMPSKWPRLDVDIINSHHQAYYSGKPGKRGPAVDWENPVPVFFLALAAGQEFTFRFLSRTGRRENVELAKSWLGEGLRYLGIGGKTSAGYGFLRESDNVPGA
jgi:CRISPR type III-B/RAMP module RAMP protein Cmr6